MCGIISIASERPLLSGEYYALRNGFHFDYVPHGLGLPSGAEAIVNIDQQLTVVDGKVRAVCTCGITLDNREILIGAIKSLLKRGRVWYSPDSDNCGQLAVRTPLSQLFQQRIGWHEVILDEQ